jgi:pilus assembly protein CpaC
MAPFIRLLCFVLAFAISFPMAPEIARAADGGAAGGVVIEVGAGRVLKIKGKVSSLFAADPKIVEVRPASPNSIFIFGVGVGRSTVAAIDEAGNPLSQFDVVVKSSSYAANEANAENQRAVPGANVRYAKSLNGLSITGTSANPQDAQQAEAAAAGFLADKQVVQDHSTITSPVQVTLRVRIAEISRSITRQFGINWTSLANFGRWGIATSITDSLSQTSNMPNTIGIKCCKTNSINTVLDLLAQDQLITMLAEPNLTARSGETASFLAGGEFPIPVGGANNQITIAFKQYGVSLAFVPTVLTEGRISLHVHPEVSELTTVGAISLPIATSLFGTSLITVPAITVRRADTTVELGSGQSFAIAGLLTANDTLNARGLPGVGELPVIGALFKSDLFQRDESELVIVVTPYIVKPVNIAGELGVPTDGYVPPGDVDRVLLNRQRARGTGPATVVEPSAAALASTPGLTQGAWPSGTGFMIQ